VVSSSQDFIIRLLTKAMYASLISTMNMEVIKEKNTISDKRKYPIMKNIHEKITNCSVLNFLSFLIKYMTFSIHSRLRRQ
jgi:hypothetical protein